jgi:hypothetical protein
MAEQDILTKRLCSIYNDLAHPNPLPSGPPARFLWFYSKALKSTFELNAASLERNFFDLLRSDKTSDDIGVYPYLSNREAVNRIKDSLQGHGNSSDRMRKTFARQLNAELRSERGGVVLFSGYPPISKRFYDDIRSASKRRVKLIFLCSSSLEGHYRQGDGLPWRKYVVPAYALGEPVTQSEDIQRLRKRIETASRRTILVGADLEQALLSFVGKPLSLLKRDIVGRLTQAAKHVPLNDLTVNEIVL